MDKGEALLNNYGVRRMARFVMYVSLMFAGGLTLFVPMTSLESEVKPWVVISWSLSLAISSTSCAWGSLTDRWIGEYVGLPLLASVFGIWALAILLAAGLSNLPLTIFGLIIFGFTSGLVARWRDVQAIKKVNSVDLPRRERDTRGNR